MKRFLAALLSVLPVKSAEPDLNRMIRVLISIEGGKWNHPTDHGGAGHISYSAWEDYTRQAYQLAMTEQYALPIYRRHLQSLIDQLKAIHIPVTPHNLGLAWRWGFTGAQRLNFIGEYGDRCAALYFDQSFK